MKRLLLLAFLLTSCAPHVIPAPPAPPPPVPVPVPVPPEPTPVPPTPVPPTPPQPPLPPDDPIAPFSLVKVGDTEASLAALPGTPTKTPVSGGVTIYAWTTSKPRPGGGFVNWEIHVQGGLVVNSFPW